MIPRVASRFRHWLAGAGTVTAIALLIAGCGYGSDGDNSSDDVVGGAGYGPDYDPETGPNDVACGELEHSNIDVDQELEVEPGIGAGAFIEYQADGTYRVTTSCDVNLTDGTPCVWDIIVTPVDGAGITSLSPIDIEQDDALTTDGTSVQLLASTEGDLDGFTLGTKPGATLRVDALLDGSCANRYLFWVGDGALHSGAPSNPVDLIPSSD